METDENAVAHIQVKFFTKQQQYAIQDIPYSLPVNVGTTELNELLNGILKADFVETEWKKLNFDFLHNGEFLRTNLTEHIESKGLTTETVLEVEYVEQTPAPRPQDSLKHDDWVSAVKSTPDLILTGCYDNTIHLWTPKGSHLMTIPGHLGPVKAVDWISHDENGGQFVSASHDQTLMIWQWDRQKNSIECAHVCRGHTRSVECVKVDASHTRFASGCWDGMLKIWSTGEDEGGSGEPDDHEQSQKKLKTNQQKSVTRTPLLTLAGHKESLSSIVWTDTGEVCTGSWDHTIRTWDLESGANKLTLPGAKVLLNLSWSPSSHLLLSGSADRHVRLWDVRVPDGTAVKSTYTSHSGWVSCVSWSPNDTNLFISGSYDNLLKLWDVRSTSVPLFNMTGHENKILCCDWSVPDHMISGGADTTVKIFEAAGHSS